MPKASVRFAWKIKCPWLLCRVDIYFAAIAIDALAAKACRRIRLKMMARARARARALVRAWARAPARARAPPSAQ